MSTALTVYDANAVSATLSTSNQLYHATAGSPATAQPVTIFGTQTGYIEIFSQGVASSTGVGSLPAQSGHGWFLDDTTLDGQDLLSGAFTGGARYVAMQGGSQAGTMTADVIIRVSRYHPGTTTYTTMLTMTLTAQTINATLTNYSTSGSAGSTLSFATGDKLYIDRFVNITAGSGNATQGIRVNRQSTDTATKVGDATTAVVTNGFQATSGGVSLSATIHGVGTLTGTTSRATSLSKTINGIGTLSGTLTVPVTVPGVSVTIAGSPVMVLEGSFEIDDAINSVSTCMFTVRDDTGLNHYKKRQKITITDSIRGLYYTGYINAVVEDNVRPQALIFSKVSVRDNHSIPEQRTYQGPEYVNEYAGPIAADMLNTLAADGITAQYASRRETTQAQLALGTLTNTTAQNNVGFGDLELSPAGTAVTIVESGATFATGTVGNTTVVGTSLAQTAFNAIKIQATNAINNAGNTYSYVKIWSGSYVVPGSNGFLNYTMFIPASSPEIKIAIDLVCSDGTTLRDHATEANAGFDAQDQSPHPGTDLVGLADGKWYTRAFLLSSALSGKTVAYATVAVEGDKTGIYTGYFYNIFLGGNGGPVTTYIYNNASSVTTQQLQNYGYSSTVVTVVPCYTTDDARTSPSYSISAAGISASTLMSWVSTDTSTPATTPVLSNGNYINGNGSQIIIRYSIDAGASYTTCVNNAPLPDFPAGLSLSGLSIQFKQFLYSSPLSPEISPTLQKMTLQIAPGYNGTKTDSTTFVDNNTAWGLGTFSNTTNNSGSVLSLSGVIRNWDNADSSNQTLFGGTNAEIFTKNRSLLIGVDGGTAPGMDAKCQNTFAPQYQNFTAEVDVLIGGWDAGFHYRTTNFGTGAGTYAFAAFVTPTAVYLARGNNTATGTNSAPASTTSTAVTLTVGNWHRLKVVANGTSHKIYLDDVLMVNTTDTNFNASGYCGFIIHNGNVSAPTHRQAQFDNFGITPALTGTWISQSVSLNALGTYYSSDFYYRNQTSDLSNCTLLAEYTINGGSTWTTIIDMNTSIVEFGGVLPGLTVGQSLSGVSITFRLTLTTTTASAQPALDSVCLKVLGGFSASGTRVSANLALTNVGRLGSSLVAWNSNLPTGTTLGVDTSIDGGSWTDVTASPGGTIPGLTVQPVATDDTFNTNTSANYTSTFATGGSTATVTYDTSNSRVTLTGGSKALYVLNTVTGSTDVDLIIDMDESDAGGLIWHYVDANNFYELVVADASSGTNPNTFNLFKTVAGTRTQLQTNLPISFTRGTYRRIRMVMKSNLMTCSMDGVVVTNTTDGSLASGKSGLRSDGGTARFYQLRVQPLGQDVTTHYVQMRLRLASTNPLATPQVLNTTLSAFGNTIQVGALIPQTAYSGKYIADNFNDLIKQCSASGGQWWWYIDKSKVFSMLPNTGVPSPWIASDNPGDFLDAGLTVTDQSDLYCNHVIVENVLATTTINEARQGDSVTRSWTFGYEWASAPTILVNGIAALVGVANVDTGKTFYYTPGNNTITMDASVTTFTSLYIINFSGTGQYLTNAVADNLAEQVAVASIDGTSGIVEFIIDGTGLTYAAGLAKAQAYVTQYSVRGKLINATTIHDGLACGQLLNVFLPQHGIFDGLYLIRGIKTRLTSGAGAGGQYQTFWYTIEAITGPDIGDWTQLYRKS